MKRRECSSDGAGRRLNGFAILDSEGQDTRPGLYWDQTALSNFTYMITHLHVAILGLRTWQSTVRLDQEHNVRVPWQPWRSLLTYISILPLYEGPRSGRINVVRRPGREGLVGRWPPSEQSGAKVVARLYLQEVPRYLTFTSHAAACARAAVFTIVPLLPSSYCPIRASEASPRSRIDYPARLHHPRNESDACLTSSFPRRTSTDHRLVSDKSPSSPPATKLPTPGLHFLSPTTFTTSCSLSS